MWKWRWKCKTFTLGLSHLRELKFRHSIQEPLNPACNWSLDIKSMWHFSGHCPLHCLKSACIRSFSGPYFPKSWVNTEIYTINLRNWIWENRDHKNSEYLFSLLQAVLYTNQGHTSSSTIRNTKCKLLNNCDKQYEIKNGAQQLLSRLVDFFNWDGIAGRERMIVPHLTR